MKTTDEMLPYVRLRFNIENPSYEDCYLEGYESSKSDIEESNNPYKPLSAEAEQWSQGWWDQFYGKEPVFQYDTIQTSELEAVYEEKASNDASFYEDAKDNVSLRRSRMTLVAKVAAMVAASFLSYQVIDLIA